MKPSSLFNLLVIAQLILCLMYSGCSSKNKTGEPALIKDPAAEDINQDITWEEFEFIDNAGYPVCAASSSLGNLRYDPSNIFDNDLATAWVEAKEGDGTGEWISFFVNAGTDTLKIFSGYGKSRDLYLANDRASVLKLSFYITAQPDGWVSETSTIFKAAKAGNDLIFGLKDEYGYQLIPVGEQLKKLSSITDKIHDDFTRSFPDLIPNWTSPLIRMEITSLYQGNKYDDACISEISFKGTGVRSTTEPRITTLKNLNISDDGKILQSLADDNRIKDVFSLEGHVVQLIDYTPDFRWAVIILMTDEPGAGRIETDYKIIHVPSGLDYTQWIGWQVDGNFKPPFSLELNKGVPEVEFTAEEGMGRIQLK